MKNNIAIFLCTMGSLIGNQNSQETTQISKPKSNSFNYIDVGAVLPLPYPGVTIGHREAFDTHSLDLSLGVYSCVFITDVSINARYLKYAEDKKNYVALGVSYYALFSNVLEVIVCSPAISYGSEYQKSFFQFDFSIMRFSNVGLDLTPALSYRYGFKF